MRSNNSKKNLKNSEIFLLPIQHLKFFSKNCNFSIYNKISYVTLLLQKD